MSHYTPITYESVKKIREEAAAAAAKKKEEEEAKVQMQKFARIFAGVTLIYDAVMAAIRADPEVYAWTIEILKFQEDARFLEPDVYGPMREEICRVFPDFAIFQNTEERWKFRFVLAQPKPSLD